MALDAEDLEQISKLIVAGNKASLESELKPLLGRLDKIEKAEPQDVAAMITKALADAAKGKKEGEGDTKVDPKVKAELARLTAKLEASELAATKAEAGRASEKMLGGLRTALLAASVPANRVQHAINHLHHGEGRVVLSDAGKPTIRFDRSASTGDYTDHLALDKGVEEWLGTDDGKAFLPSKRVAGVDPNKPGTKPLKTSDGKINGRAIIGRALALAAGRAPST